MSPAGLLVRQQFLRRLANPLPRQYIGLSGAVSGGGGEIAQRRVRPSGARTMAHIYGTNTLIVLEEIRTIYEESFIVLLGGCKDG